MRSSTLLSGAILALQLTLGAALADSATVTSPPSGVIFTAFAAPAGAMRTAGPIRAYRPTLHVVRHSRDWLASLPLAKGGRDWKCLTDALYFEARGEPVKGQFAVAEVILNRVDAPGYPGSVCGVVNQGGRKGCQFSYTCDGQPKVIRERAAYEAVGKVARLMLDGAPRVLTQGATHFHSRAVRPGWSHRLPRTAAIGHHLFYRESGAI